MASSVDLPTPEPAKTPTRWPRQSGVNRSMTRTPVFSGWVTRSRSMAGGGATSMATGAGPAGSGPAPSTGSPSALMTRPFHSGAGLKCIAPIRRATMPMPTEKRLSNGLIVASASSMRTTSPIDEAAAGVEAHPVAELHHAGDAAHAVMRRRDFAHHAAELDEGKLDARGLDGAGETFEAVHARGSIRSAKACGSLPDRA